MVKVGEMEQLKISAAKSKAFSLLEVLLVLFLVGLIMTLAVPFFNNPKSDVKQITSEFVYLVNCARDKATITNKTHFLKIDNSQKKILVINEDDRDLLFLDEKEDSKKEDNKESITKKTAKIKSTKCSLRSAEINDPVILDLNIINKDVNIGSLDYDNKKPKGILLRFDPSGFSDLFKITFTSGPQSITFEQTSVLGNYNVSATQ